MDNPPALHCHLASPRLSAGLDHRPLLSLTTRLTYMRYEGVKGTRGSLSRSREYVHETWRYLNVHACMLHRGSWSACNRSCSRLCRYRRVPDKQHYNVQNGLRDSLCFHLRVLSTEIKSRQIESVHYAINHSPYV